MLKMRSILLTCLIFLALPTMVWSFGRECSQVIPYDNMDHDEDAAVHFEANINFTLLAPSITSAQLMDISIVGNASYLPLSSRTIEYLELPFALYVNEQGTIRIMIFSDSEILESENIKHHLVVLNWLAFDYFGVHNNCFCANATRFRRSANSRASCSASQVIHLLPTNIDKHF
jgi:hypothetical protein